ncbi:hypothetical protein JT359_04815 [Candidatus Poribacteria bacterium]|nr:hypothetical protein [Candidatus Poribacteria bacterium]
MYLKYRILFGIIIISLLIAPQILAQAPPATQLTTIQTAEPIGKGGSTTSIGFFQYAKKDGLAPDHSQSVVIGGFEESREVNLDIQTFLVPIRFIYGLSDKLDMQLGATLSTGGVQKVVKNFYNAEDSIIEGKDRVYQQQVYEGVIGLKYNIKPELNDGFPSISVGGDFYFGLTADDRLNSNGNFIDTTPIDGFPFIGAYPYIVGTHRIGRYFKVHAGLGISLSSKMLKTTDFFITNWSAGGEVAVSDNLWIAADFNREQQYAGISVSNMLGLAMRYALTDNSAFQIGINSLPGIHFSLTLGGVQAEATKGDKLLF